MPVNIPPNNPYKNFLVSAGSIAPSQTAPQQTIQTAPQQQPSIKTPEITLGSVQTDTTTNNKSAEQNNQDTGHKKLFGIIGISVGSALLLGIIAIFALSKGFSGGIARKLTQISDKAKKAIYDITTGSQNLTGTQKAKLFMHKGIQHFADAMQASSNFTAVKDSGSSHYLKKFGLSPIIDKINNFYKNKIILKNKNIAYSEAEVASIKFCEYIEKIASEKNSPELAQKAEKIMSEYMSKFSTQKHLKRSEEAWQSMKGLDEKVYSALYKKKGGFFKNLKQLRSYLTLDFTAPRRTMVHKDLNTAKSKISNSLYDVNNNLKQAMNELKISINPKNTEAVKILTDITKLLEEGKNLNGSSEHITRTELFTKIQQNLSQLLEIAKTDLKSSKDYNLAEQRIFKLYDLLKPESYQKGLAQEVITDLKTLLPEGKDSPEYRQAAKYLEKMNTKLNNAISNEMSSYEKLAELSVGSAPTDIIGILWPTALGAALVVNADTSDKKISKALTQGIPILGGVGVTYYGTLRGFTGVKNLVLGLASMELLNIIGTKVDGLVKKYRVEQKKLKAAFESLTKLQKTQDKNPPGV